MDVEHSSKISTVIHSFCTMGTGLAGFLKSDLLFVDGTPFVVLEWRNFLSFKIPSKIAALNPVRLHPASCDDADYFYEGAVN